MRDNTHNESLERWAQFMKEHPLEWKKIHTAFINAQFIKSKKFIQRLLSSPSGRDKLIALYKIKNLKGYEKLLK